MRLIHKLDIRSLCCTLCYIGRYLHVRFLLPASQLFLSRPNSSKFDRRRGFSNRATAAMFVATVINFLLSSLYAGSHVAEFIVFIRKTLILGIDHYHNTLWKVSIVTSWAESLPVSIKLSLPDPVPIHVPSDITQRSDCHLESLGPLPRTTVGSPHTVYCVDWNCG